MENKGAVIGLIKALGSGDPGGAGATPAQATDIAHSKEKLIHYTETQTVPYIAGIEQSTGQSTDKVMSQKSVTDALAGKLAVSTATDSSWMVYGKEAGPTQQMIPVNSAPAENSVAYRSTGGTLQVGTPTENNHAATKEYVDTHGGAPAPPASQKYVDMTAAGYTIDEATDNNIYITTAVTGQAPALAIAKISEIPLIENIIIDAVSHPIMLFGSTVGIGHAVIDGTDHDISAAGYLLNGLYKIVGRADAATVILKNVGAEIGISVEQSTGQATDKVMSQKAVTDELNTKVSKSGNETISGVKTFTGTVKTNNITAKDNNTLEIRGKSVALVTEEAGSTAADTKLIVMSGDSTKAPAAFPFDNAAMDLGTTEQQFKDLHMSGSINDIPAAELQKKSKINRIQNGGSGEGEVIDSDEFTDIFAYQGRLTFKAGFTGKQIKTFYIDKGFTLDNIGGLVPKINVDFVEKTLPYTADAKMYLVGYTTDNCPLFRRGIPLPAPTAADAGKTLKVNSAGDGYVLV